MQSYERIVALYPTSHGFGFAVFEDETTLLDWGHAHIRPATRSKCMERIAELLSWYSPKVVVVEDTTDSLSRRGDRVRKLLHELTSFTERSSSHTARIPNALVKKAFSPSGNINKQEIARIISAHYPELQFQVPPPRKIWMSEDERMSIFCAAALVMTFIHGPIYKNDIT